MKRQEHDEHYVLKKHLPAFRLRLQVKDYAEECARLRAEVARLKKEAKKA